MRYCDKNGEVVERFVGLVHVSDTSTCSLKEAICSLLSEHSLSPSQIRGQGYDGASNMWGEISGPKTLIMKDCSSAYYFHCFAHQLQLTFVAIAKKHLHVEDFFCHVTNVLNVIGGSFKHRDLLRHLQAEKLEQLLESSEVHIGRGLNQERGLQRPGDTRWGSHFKTLDNFIVIFSSIVRVLEVIKYEELNDRFDVVSSDLLLGMASLNSVNSFVNFDKGRIMTLANCYPNELDEVQIRDLSYQRDTYIVHMRAGNPKFSNLQGISHLAKALVEANLVETYSYVYLLLKLTLILPVATATVERAFSSMKQIKNEERNSMGDQYLNDCLICYIERDVFTNVVEVSVLKKVRHSSVK
ncbi:uncharacterized protein [Nicotiana sylvestris]|uniref:uncharacterized protein n=1 Tax=Nicotiana sylvestris TaxID=4096 RepID=UPI00388CE18E